MKFEWKGVMPAVTTKFNQDDSLDLKVFRKNIEAQVEAGVHGIVLGGSLGEASTLTAEEKKVLIKETIQIVEGKIPVIMTIAEQATTMALQAVKDAQESGANGLMILPPMRYKSTDYETVEYFKEITRSTELPIMIYNNPVDYKIEVTVSMFKELLELKNITAVKESTRDIINIGRLRNAFGKDLSILTGVDPLALESLLIGADGWVAGLVCAFPAETVAIYELAKAGYTKEATEIYRWFLPLLELDISPQLVQNIKLAEVATGIGTETVRKPRLPLQGKERERVLQVIDAGLKNRPVLPDYKNLTAVNKELV
ncbi:dihydrodipicolinate synthase family protein [Zobellia sp. 1_MG-2023]|uniref:dihydrodipicolinate synthase family protein n=1 Tax=Zobellia sp. 1_MG-2023 TaxID=3062626 RepID=UPI0026E33B5B|nr:dihydrodipicolinate synthase family protein [Zobellia sp. 1_MG-2023]MDO6820840.1 dihydrodipicolinate synthase family protein [Zobellia sp. 1_MG-2023]